MVANLENSPEATGLDKVSFHSNPKEEKVKVKLFSCVRLFVTPWTIVYQASLSMGFFQAKSTGVGCHFLLQWIFLNEGSNPGLLHCGQKLYL